MSKEQLSTRLAAGEAILELAREGMDVVALSADTSKSMYTSLLKEEFPERFIDTGIAEQNMIRPAAGLAATGKIPFAASYSVFTSMRCCEQLRTFVAYPNLNVKVIAGIGGFSAGIEGVTHVATEDLGIMRCIANMAVVAPCDYYTTKLAVKAAAAYPGPVYLRVGRDPSPVVEPQAQEFIIGKPVLHRSGEDILLIATGLVLTEALDAADDLRQEGINVGVLEMHTLKPILDAEDIIARCQKAKKILTIEEHNIVGGLASVISELLCGKGEFQLEHMGLKDQFARTGTPQELRQYYGMDKKAITQKVREMKAL